VASAIAGRVGGDPGYPGLRGPSETPPAGKPRRLAMLETAAWPKASAGAQAAFGQARQRLAELGVEMEDRHSDPDIAAVEDAIADAVPVTFQIFDWEFRWPLGHYARRNGLSEGMRQRLASGQQMTLDDYRVALRRREEIRKRYAEASGRYDAFVTLAATGAAPVGLTWTGDPAFNVPASLLGVPAISLPFLHDEDMPLGLQFIGRADEDAQLMAHAQWLWQNY
jgi:Asp-tRNA(Asn)/Glu-tRNA(Gln) amidotransferase A subunit family amidase